MPLKMEDNDKGSYFFWHAESRMALDEGNTDIPLVIWLNGGPGCSSNVGLFYENGPYTMTKSADPTLKYQLNRNDFSWTNVAHMVWVEQPLRTGFSIPSNDKKDPRVHNEYDVANDFHDFLTSFFEVFGHLKSSKLYIVGESYGGRYVPAIAEEVARRGKFNLHGIGVGNGVIDPIQDNSYAEYAYYHGMIGKNAKEFIEYRVAHCDEIKKDKKSDSGGEEDPCDMMSQVLDAAGHPNEFNTGTYNQYDSIFQGIYNVFFNDPEMQELIHVRGKNIPGVQFTNGHYTPSGWTSCNDAIATDMTPDKPSSSVPSLQYLAERVRVLLYSGDLDMSCNIVGTTWTLEANEWLGKRWFNARRALWRVGGSVQDVAGDYSYLDDGQFGFLVVHKSGHLVPMDLPEQALDMITRLVRGQSYADQPIPSDSEYVAKLKGTGFIGEGLDTFVSALVMLSLAAMFVTAVVYARKRLNPSAVDAASRSGSGAGLYQLVDQSSSHEVRLKNTSTSAAATGAGDTKSDINSYQRV